MMDKAPNYPEFEKLGMMLDKLKGKDVWKANKESSLYDWPRIEEKIKVLQKLRSKKDMKSLVQYLRQDLQKNTGGISNPILYN